MTGLVALCLAGPLGIALLILLAVRAMGWRRRRIGMLVRPWLLAILLLLTIGLAAESSGGIGGFTPTGWTLAGAWLAVSLTTHLAGRGSRRVHPAGLWGARMAHSGIAVALGGILLSSALTSAAQHALAPGERVRFDAWTIQLYEVWPAAGEGWAGVAAELRATNGGGVVLLEPQQRTMFDRSSQSQPARFSSGSGLLTATLGARDADGRWPIGLRWTPLLVLIPLGLAIAALGCAVAMVGPAMARWRRLRRARLATAWWA